MGKTYFISDLHLGAGYISDGRAHQQRVVRFLDSRDFSERWPVWPTGG